MSRAIRQAIKISQNSMRRDKVSLTFITHNYGTYDPLSGSTPDTPTYSGPVHAVRQRVDATELKDTKVQLSDTKLLVQQSLVSNLDVSIGANIVLDNLNYEIIYTYLDSSNSLRVLYVRRS